MSGLGHPLPGTYYSAAYFTFTYTKRIEFGGNFIILFNLGSDLVFFFFLSIRLEGYYCTFKHFFFPPLYYLKQPSILFFLTGNSMQAIKTAEKN